MQNRLPLGMSVKFYGSIIYIKHSSMVFNESSYRENHCELWIDEEMNLCLGVSLV